MANLLRFIPLRQETLQMIRDRMDIDVNAGRDPEDYAFLDTTEGGFYWDLTQTWALEAERLWDMASVDVPATAFVEYSFGEYLDAHGETITVPRKAAVAATGEVTFTLTTGEEDAMIAVGTEVSTTQTDPEEEPVSFVTIASGVVQDGTPLTLPVRASDPGGHGNVVANAVDLVLSPVDAIESVANAEPITGGADVETDESYRTRLKLEYSAAQGAGSVADYQRWALAYPGIGHVRVVPLWAGAGTVRVVVTDENNDPVSTTVRDALQQLLDPFSGVTQLNGAVADLSATATLTVDDTTGFADDGRLYLAGQVVTYTGKTGTTFTGVAGGTGAVADNAAVVQQGEGRGLAPIGALVAVDTPTTLNVTVAADVTYDDGYSADGAAGTTGLQEDIEQAVRDYIDNLPPGGEDPPGLETPPGSGFVLLNRTESRFFQVQGVYNVASVTLNAVAADLAVGPLQVPALLAVTLT